MRDFKRLCKYAAILFAVTVICVAFFESNIINGVLQGSAVIAAFLLGAIFELVNSKKFGIALLIICCAMIFMMEFITPSIDIVVLYSMLDAIAFQVGISTIKKIA